MLLFALVLGFLYVARATLIAFLFAIFFAYLMSPLVAQLAAYPKAPIAVLDLHRGIEYGLGFYRNQQMEAYRPGAGRRLLIAPMDSVSVPREKIFVGEYGPTRLGIWWVER